MITVFKKLNTEYWKHGRCYVHGKMAENVVNNEYCHKSLFELATLSNDCCDRGTNYKMGVALGKQGFMHVRKVSSQITLCSLHRLIMDGTFRFYDILSLKKVSYKKIQFRWKVSSLINLITPINPIFSDLGSYIEG